MVDKDTILETCDELLVETAIFSFKAHPVRIGKQL